MDADVVVIGAGMAGLTAAADLVKSDLSVIVLDARGRVGGRIATLHDPETPVPVELGAEFLHGEAKTTLELVRALRLTTHALDGDWWLTRRGRLSRVDFDDIVERGLAATFRAGRGGKDVPVARGLARLRSDLGAVTRSFVEGFHAADPATASMRAFAKGGAEGPGRSLRIASGYGSLARGVAMQIAGNVRLGCIVTRIEHRHGDVRVTYRGATGHETQLRARAAVVAVPLGVLQAPEGSEGAIAFHPPLDRSRALAGLAMGHVTKTTIRFREAFWREGKREKAAFFVSPAEAVPTFWTALPEEAPVLVAWAGGPRAETLSALGPSRVAEVAVDSLARTLGVDAERVHGLVEAFFVHDWSRDPFARGAYSYARVGGAGAFKRLAASVADTLFFAGEHTCAPPANGTIDGAIASGQRAARELRRVFGHRQRRAA